MLTEAFSEGAWPHQADSDSDSDRQHHVVRL